MARRRKKADFSELSNEQIALKGIEYVNKKDATKELDKQCKELRKPLEEYLAANGKELASGSILAVVSHADVDVHLKKTLRVSKVLLPEAFDVLTECGCSECIENVPTIREDVLERLIGEGKINEENLKKIYGLTKSYAFSVELKDRMPDAPE